MSISRTKVNALVDDDGSNSVGTVYNKARVVDIYDDVDAFVTNWVTFAATWTNLTVGNGTLIAKWARVNKVICVEVVLLFGSTTTITGAVTMTLPVNNTGLASAQSLGNLGMYDTSAGSFYAGHVLVSTASVAGLYNNATPIVAVAAAVPFTWANTDQLSVRLCYQEA